MTDELGGHVADSVADSRAERAPAADRSAEPGANLASHTVPLATPEQAALKTMNPWILLKVKALGELVPAAGIELEQLIDQLREPHKIADYLLREHGVRLSDLEVERYSGWLPHIRRDALRKAEEESERNVQEVRTRRRRQ
ncbi:MAG TPA: hypothetical protein VL523_14330 [Terriglobia bacterium]|nr:hypothetical protein [Terriglobia bacterium]